MAGGGEVLYWIGHRGGFDVDAVDIRAAAARLHGRPALFVCNSGRPAHAFRRSLST